MKIRQTIQQAKERKQAKASIDLWMREHNAKIFCHAKGCKRGFEYLSKFGYCKQGDKTFCMEHQSHLLPNTRFGGE